METEKMNLWDELLVEGVMGMLDLDYFKKWDIYRQWPFWRRGTSEVKRLYTRSKLKITDVKAIINFCDERIDFSKTSRLRLIHLIATLSREGMHFQAILILLKEIADYIRKEKINALLSEEIYCLNPFDSQKPGILPLAGFEYLEFMMDTSAGRAICKFFDIKQTFNI